MHKIKVPKKYDQTVELNGKIGVNAYDSGLKYELFVKDFSLKCKILFTSEQARLMWMPTWQWLMTIQIYRNTIDRSMQRQCRLHDYTKILPVLQKFCCLC